jgi:predicted AAA+ superfamily ATPase
VQIETFTFNLHKMLNRDFKKILTKFSKTHSVIAIFGPRQSGKTALVISQFKGLPYVSFAELASGFKILFDPKGFFEQYKNGAIFDEVQNIPELVPCLQQLLDSLPQSQRKKLLGKFILISSQNLLLNPKISPSFKKTIAVLTLLSPSLTEKSPSGSLNNKIFRGAFPMLLQRRGSVADFFSNYLQTLLGRDLKRLHRIDELAKFHNFLKFCAGRIGQVVNFSALAADCGISHTTARSWLALLESSYVIFLLPPYARNLGKKRSIKMPKIYFYDSGFACNLLGIEKKEQVATHFLRGALFENLVILELLKSRTNQGLPANLSFWRDGVGHEIDCVVEEKNKLKAFEIKSAATLNCDFVKDLKYFSKLHKNKVEEYLVYGGNVGGEYLGTELVSLKSLSSK